MNTKQFIARVTAAESETTTGISPGVSCQCGDCQSAYNMTREEMEANPIEESGSFSHSDCDCCGSMLGGDRYAAHAMVEFNGKTELCHYDICQDCVMFLANGDLPE